MTAGETLSSRDLFPQEERISNTWGGYPVARIFERSGDAACSDLMPTNECFRAGAVNGETARSGTDCEPYRFVSGCDQSRTQS
jgi:hypothetical protein